MGLFEGLSLEAFVERALPVISKHWPGLRAAGEEALRERVTRIARRALAEGMQTEGELLRWVNVAFVLGDGFADDPKLPEVRAVLASALPAISKLEALARIALREARRRG